MDSPAPIATAKTTRNTIIKRCVITALVVGALWWVSMILPVFCSASPNARLTTAALNASGIYKSLLLYAQDHDGKFPEATANSNQAFRRLFPDYMEDEKVFFVPRSAWHDAAPNHRPDGDIGIKPNYDQCLLQGENHWAYVSGLNPDSPHQTPVIADGFVEGQIGTYTDDPKQKGGVWKGKKAIVIYIGGGAEHIELSRKTGFRVLHEKGSTGPKIALFSHESSLPENAKVLNPE